MRLDARYAIAATALAAILALAACTAEPDPTPTATTTAEPEPTQTETTAPEPTPTETAEPAPEPVALKDLEVRLDKVAGGFDRPLLLTSRPGDDRLYVVQQGGKIISMNADGGDKTTVLNLSGTAGGDGSEQGLLGLAFHPADPSRMFVSYTNDSGDSRLAEYSFPLDADKADPARVQIVLRQSQPYSNHNGGMIAFGPDGLLYVGFGDGGSGGDPQGNGQKTGTWHGSILRIDVNAAEGYAIPAGNPFADGGGKPEVWAYGLRNPWRFSFDGDWLYVGDVGQGRVEEVSVVDATTAAGANFGWNEVEGDRCYPSGDDCTGENRGFVPAVHTYDQKDGRCSVTGGYVSRDLASPGLYGVYLFGDYCTGEVLGLRVEDGERTDKRMLRDTDARISSFGIDNDGRVYLVDLAGGAVYRVVEK